MTYRIFLHPSRVAVSLPGYDVLSAPRTEQFLALDSSWGTEVRPVTVQQVFNRSVLDGISIGFAPQATIPVAQVHVINLDGSLYEDNWIHPTNPGFFSGSTDYWQTAWYYVISKSSLNIQTVGGYVQDWVTVRRNWNIVVWPTS